MAEWSIYLYLLILRQSYLAITSVLWLNLEFSLKKKKKREVTGWVLKTIYNLNNRGILRHIPLSPNLYYKGFEFLCGLGIHRRRGKIIPLRNSSREERILQGITIGLRYLRYCVLFIFDALVWAVAVTGVKYLSLLIYTTSECIL